MWIGFGGTVVLVYQKTDMQTGGHFPGAPGVTAWGAYLNFMAIAN